MGRIVAIVLVVLVGIGAVGWYLQREPAQHSDAATMVQKPLPLPPSATQPIRRNEPQPDVTAPGIATPESLDGSDGAVRGSIHALAPTLVTWLTPEEQLRKWVALVDAVAEGKLPAKNLPLKYPMQGFSVVAQGDEDVSINPANFNRANLLIETITAIPPRKFADYYHAYSPLLERAYAELGRGGNFEARLTLAIQKVRDVKPLTADAKLARPKFYYTYADPALEQSSDVAKLLWRLGPANQQQLQSYLGELQPLL
ncbi:MAG: DUF3014 domain-containing protein [Spongiibacteraceae bacterium]